MAFTLLMYSNICAKFEFTIILYIGYAAIVNTYASIYSLLLICRLQLVYTVVGHCKYIRVCVCIFVLIYNHVDTKNNILVHGKIRTVQDVVIICLNAKPVPYNNYMMALYTVVIIL